MATKRNITPKPRRSRKQQILRLVISLLGGLGAVILYYLAFSIFFDTPMEYALKHRTDRLKQYLPKNITPKETEEYVLKALEYYHRHRAKTQNRDR